MRFKVENWTIIKGEQEHSVQLLHTYSNNRVGIFLNDTMLYRQDIGPNGSGQFQLLVDGEPYRISVAMIDGRYRYELEILDDQSKSAKVRRKKELQTGILFIATLFFALAIAVIPTMLKQYKIYKRKMELARYGETAPGTVIAVLSPDSESEGKAIIKYRFADRGDQVEGEIASAHYFDGMAISSVGMPISVGDEFGVRYLLEKTEISDMHFDFPTPAQMLKYRNLAAKKCWDGIPLELMNPRYKVYCGCLSFYAYQQYGIEGLAELVHQQTDRDLYGRYNTETYLRFMKKADMREAEEQCMEMAAEGNK